MDLAAILAAIGPTLISFLGNLAAGLKSPVPPPSTTVAADAAVKDLQTMLNKALNLNPPLVVDGWLGPKTDAAIEAGIALLKAAGIG